MQYRKKQTGWSPAAVVAAGLAAGIGCILGPWGQAAWAGESGVSVLADVYSVLDGVEDYQHGDAVDGIYSLSAFAEVADHPDGDGTPANVASAYSRGSVYGPLNAYASLSADGSYVDAPDSSMLAEGNTQVYSHYRIDPGTGDTAPALGSVVSVDLRLRVNGAVRYYDPNDAFGGTDWAVAGINSFVEVFSPEEYKFIWGGGGVAVDPYEDEEFVGHWTFSTDDDGMITGVLDVDKTYSFNAIVGDEFFVLWDLIAMANAPRAAELFFEVDFDDSMHVDYAPTGNADFAIVQVDAIPEPAGLLTLLAGPALLLRRRRH